MVTFNPVFIREYIQGDFFVVNHTRIAHMHSFSVVTGKSDGPYHELSRQVVRKLIKNIRKVKAFSYSAKEHRVSLVFPVYDSRPVLLDFQVPLFDMRFETRLNYMLDFKERNVLRNLFRLPSFRKAENKEDFKKVVRELGGRRYVTFSCNKIS